jgi:outer membrane lipoprotein-sorting protein
VKAVSAEPDVPNSRRWVPIRRSARERVVGAANSPYNPTNREDSGDRHGIRGFATDSIGDALFVALFSRRIDRNAAQCRLAAFLALVGVSFVPLGTHAATGDMIPLPRPNPLVAASEPQTVSSQPTGFRQLFGGSNQQDRQPRPDPNSPFTPAQQAALFKISNYFNSFDTMEGEFIQVGPHGEQSEGVFVIDKPGKIRFQYKPPVKLDVISDGRSVAIRDSRANTQDLYPLSKTPLRYLLSDRIDLTSSKIVDRVREEADLVSLDIIEKGALVKGKLTLIFDRDTNELRQWIVTDAQGLSTSVAIFNTTTGKTPDPGLFRIYIQPKTGDR